MPASQQNQNKEPTRRFRLGSFATMLAVSVVVAATGGIAWQLVPKRHPVYTDADSIRLPADQVTPRDILWDAPREVSGIPLQPGDYDPAMSADGQTFYFVRGEPGANADIWFTSRVPAGWSEPAPLVSVNSPFDEMGPSPTTDGLAIYFSSDRPGGHGGYDLWVAQRESNQNPFDKAINLGPIVNTRGQETAPCSDPGDDALFFASDRPSSSAADAPDPFVDRVESAGSRHFDIYVARDLKASTANVESFEIANSNSDETTPAVSPAGDFLYFASNRSGGRGGLDIYRIRLNGDANTPERLDDTINTTTDQTDPALAMMGYDLYLRTFDPAGSRDSRIVLSHSREVFRATAIEQASVDWGAIGAVMILAFSAILLLFMARAMVDSALRRRLSLMAQCMLASVALHLVLAFVLGLWHVTASLAGWSPRSGAQRIALSQAAGGSTLTEQVRGGFGESVSAQTTPEVTKSPQSLAFSPPAPTSVREPSPPRQSRSAFFQAAQAVDQPSVAAVAVVTPSQTRAVAPRSPRANTQPAAVKVSTPRASRRPTRSEPARRIADSVATSTPLVSAPAPRTATADAPSPEPAAPSLRAALAVIDSRTPDRAPKVVAAAMPSFEVQTATVSRTPAQVPTATSGNARFAIPTAKRIEQLGHAAAESESDGSIADSASMVRPAGPDSRPASIDRSTLAMVTDTRIEPAMDRGALDLMGEPGARAARVPAPTVDTDLAIEPGLPRLPTGAPANRAPIANDPPAITDSLALPESTHSPNDEPLGPGWITGRVIDAETRRPIAAASVELDRADDEPVIATTESDGRYALKAAGVPDHFALTASADDYVPASINIAPSDVERRVLWVDFELPPQTPDTIAIETTPNVHHLGDNRFTGRINSRFQKRAEGGRYTATFILTANQLPPHYRQCELTLLARGVQMAHPIHINGRRLRDALDWSPRDGRFGKLSIDIPIDLLQEGENTIHIRARKRGDDRDDFEFVNLQFHLSR